MRSATTLLATVALLDLVITATAWSNDPCCPADVDGSGEVNALDLGVVLGAFGASDGIGDVDDDGDVDAADVAGVLDAWGACADAIDDPGRLLGTYQIDLVELGSFNEMDVTVADVDQDVDLDVVLVGSAQDLLVILRRECDNSFATPQTYSMGDNPTTITVADVNGDGNVDAVASCLFSDDVVIRFGAPDGSFGPAHSHGVGDRPVAVSLADLNGDTLLDLASANEGAQNVVVRLNDGRGGFGSPYAIASGFNPRSLAAADFDDDGAVDIAVASGTSNAIHIYRNLGTGSFELAASLAAASGLRRILANDLDADGDVDVAAACANQSPSPDMVVYRNVGRGTFASPTGYALMPNTTFLASADLDEDGDEDLMGATTSALTTLLNNGDGTFVYGAASACGGPIHSLGVADVEQDGDIDVFTSALGTKRPMVGFLLNDGDGDLGEVLRLPTGGAPYCGAATDLDRDGDMDLVVGDSAYQREGVTVIQNVGGAAFEPWQSYPTSHIPVAIEFADLDNDRDDDLLVLLLGGGFEVRWNDGGGGLATSTTYWMPIDSTSFCARDLDADGDVDVAILGFSGGLAHIRLNDGTGVFAPATTYPMGGQQQKSLVCDDMNGDGAPDLVVASGLVYNESKLTMRWNDGKGSFGALTTITMPLWITAAVAGDLDHDGDLDIVATNEDQTGVIGSIAVRLNDGAGALGPATIYPTLAYPSTAVLRDFDEDGFLDVAVCSQDLLMVRFGAGDGSFGPPFSYVAGLSPRMAIVGDFDGDGDADIATPNTWSADVTVRWNQLSP